MNYNIFSEGSPEERFPKEKVISSDYSSVVFLSEREVRSTEITVTLLSYVETLIEEGGVSSIKETVISMSVIIN